MRRQPSALVQFIHFLGRVQFTMVLLIGGAVVMTVGTIIESRLGVEAAQTSVYRTLWFDAFLALIAVNLVVAVVNRIPIQRHQWAFVLTHFSIVVLLFGAWVSRTFGIEGRLAVREGETQSSMSIDGTELAVRSNGDLHTWEIPSRVGPSGLELGEHKATLPDIRVAEVIRDGEFMVGLEDNSDARIPTPGVDFHIQGKGIHRHDFLLAEHARFRRKDLGPLELEILVGRSDEFFEQRLSAQTSAAAVVSIQPLRDLAATQISVPRDIGKLVRLADGTEATVERFVQRARVTKGKLTDNPAAPANPAAVVKIRNGDCVEEHTIFSQYPDFNIAKGREGDGLVKSVRLRASSAGSKPLASILIDPRDDRLWVQLSASIGRGAALPFRPGETVAIGNLGIDLKVIKYRRSAKTRVNVRPAEQKGEGRTYLRALVGTARESLWLPLGSPRSITINAKQVDLEFRRRSHALPFELTLDEFQVAYHPGSGRPSQYQSNVSVARGTAEKTSAVISMNRPLDVAGYRLFQTSYKLGHSRSRDITILTASYDPGVPIVYPAFLMLIVGIAWYLVGSGRRTRSRAARKPEIAQTTIAAPNREDFTPTALSALTQTSR